ncbi:MAG: phage tail protein [Chitinophagaceae bacterium]|nr:phage tail protein [Chitinophagaceae bacterium]
MDSYIGEVRMFGGNFAPRNWALCQGQLLSIAANNALFSILGTTFGGDGRTTFALPDLRGRVAVGTGTGPGLSTIRLGEVYGSETVTLLQPNLPVHTHALTSSLHSTWSPACSDATSGNTNEPTGAVPAASATSTYAGSSDGTKFKPTPLTNFGGNVTPAIAGGNQPHNNLMPILAVNYMIALYGIYPSRN